MLLTSALGALALGAIAGPANAATPFTAGTGGNPSVAVGSEGTGHVVWATPNPTKVGYCRVSAGAQACNRTELLAFGAATNAQTTGRPTVFTPAPNKVVIVAGCWNCPTGIEDRTYRWISTDNGATFGAPVEISRGITTNGTGVWLDDVGPAGLWVGAAGARVKAQALTTSEGVLYASGPLFVYGPEITRIPGTQKLVAATNDLDVVKYGVFTGPTLTAPNVNDASKWIADRTLVGAEGDNDETALNSGPNGVYLTYKYFVANNNRLGLRRFDNGTNDFGPATYVEGGDAIDNHSLDYPDSFQDASGRLHVVWRSLYDGGRLRYRVSDTGGANFTAAANLARQETFLAPEIAAAGDGTGFVTWSSSGGGGGNIRIVAIDPQPEPVTTPPPGGGTPPPGGGTPPPGGGTPPPGGGGAPVPTIKPVFTFTGRGNSLTATIVGRRIKVRMRGAITLPAGTDRSTACTGKVRLKVKKGKRTMLNRTVRVKFKKGKCRFAKTVFLKRSKVGKTRWLKLKVRFLGNTVLKAGSISKTLVIKK